MIVGVIGLGHLGTVTAACLAKHFRVMAWDLNKDERYKAHNEPAIEELWQNRIASGCLTVSSAEDVAKAELIWLAIDTPLSNKGAADTGDVMARAHLVLQHAAPGTTVLVSSQLPAGSVAKLEALYPALSFACMPENLRIGHGLHGFQQPDRVVLGVRPNTYDKPRLQQLFKPFSDNLIWVSVESAEMTKHAINAFLATSIALANELGVLAMYVGADPKEVERGMKSDPRIGERAYVGYGGGPGPHLQRDLKYLQSLALGIGAKGGGVNWNFFEAVSASHERFSAHR